LGWQETSEGKTCPLHWEAVATSPQLPAASQQTTIGQGLGWHEVAVLGTPLRKGHGTAVEHAPVCGSQQTLTGGQGLGLQVTPV
jgi:hypothetical protein